MSEYIDREVTIGLLEDKYRDMSAMPASYYAGFLCALNVLKRIRSATDVSGVRHGYWEEASDGDGAVCSECGTDFCTMIHKIEKFNYCPVCGCRMDKEV